MRIKIKRLHPDAVIPKYSKAGDAAVDLIAVSSNHQNWYYEYGTGIAIEVPEGFVGLIYPRSSISNMDLALCNSVGVIDSGYRGEIRFRFSLTQSGATKIQLGHNVNIYQIGERIGQLMIVPYPKIQFEEVLKLSPTERGDGGYGSTGK
jgi:dUTP pyrophosphatase